MRIKKSGAIPPETVDEYGIISYSQEGEDVVLRRFVGEHGFYVDIGAHHPKRFSNSYFFYKLGWRGINIDADPDLIQQFESVRPRDINIATGVGAASDELTFYVFNEKAVNTFIKEVAEDRKKVKGWHVVEERKIPVVPLFELLDANLPKGQKIDFMSIDVEGKDLEVLESNDWSKYRPRFLLVECFGVGTSDKAANDINKFLKKINYQQVAKTYFTGIFADMQQYVGH